jgi:hypothetical protein
MKKLRNEIITDMIWLQVGGQLLLLMIFPGLKFSLGWLAGWLLSFFNFHSMLLQLNSLQNLSEGHSSKAVTGYGSRFILMAAGAFVILSTGYVEPGAFLPALLSLQFVIMFQAAWRGIKSRLLKVPGSS